jgi:hypothetical protein
MWAQMKRQKKRIHDTQAEHTTLMWRETGKYWRMQTNNPEVHAMLKKHAGAELCGYGINCRLWAYRLSFARPQNAISGLCAIAGGIVEKVGSEGLVCAKTDSVLSEQEGARTDAVHG